MSSSTSLFPFLSNVFTSGFTSISIVSLEHLIFHEDGGILIFIEALSAEWGKLPTFWVQCGPIADQNLRKVRIADLMPTLRTFLATLAEIGLATLQLTG